MITRSKKRKKTAYKTSKHTIFWEISTAVNIVEKQLKSRVVNNLKIKAAASVHRHLSDCLKETLSDIFMYGNQLNELDLMGNVLLLDSFEKRMKLYFQNINTASKSTIEPIMEQYQKIYYDVLDIYLICLIVAAKASVDTCPGLYEYRYIYGSLHKETVSLEPLIMDELTHLKLLDYKVASFSRQRMHSLFRQYVPTSERDKVNQELTTVGFRAMKH